ncbi:putative regulator of septum formation [Actinocorallia herbida]|uniref:Putative regulator of septum formation n=1 Tax=Actinocorallia herbida TaxID=58109 RepID=A0A3N1CWE8_9ACTN|nr:DUF4190 domain-containing protein [Actinocorallia herbida]ROO85038.1 putative regulator of septum formation [Actinocorallia herbida]
MTHDPFGGRGVPGSVPPPGQGSAYGQVPGSQGPYPQGPYLPGAPVPGGRDRPRNGLAIGALVFGVIGGVCVSVPLAIAALVRVRRTGGPGTGMAIAGIVLSAVWLAAGSLVAALVFAVADEMEEVKLTQGACFNAPVEDESLVERTMTNCAKPHMYQVLSVEALGEGPYPGDGEVVRRGEEKCLGRWDGALLQSPYAETHRLTYALPTRVAWPFDKTVACLLESIGGKKRPFADLSAVPVDQARKTWSALVVADCFDLPEEEAATVVTVACDEPHDAQVVRTFSFAEGRWPGRKRVDERSGARCDRMVGTFFDAHPPGILTDYTYVGPTRAEWAAGDRRVLCLVESGYDDESLTTSLVP